MQLVQAIADAQFTAERANKVNAVKTDQLVGDVVYLREGQAMGWRCHPDRDLAVVCLQGEGELLLEVRAGAEMAGQPMPTEPHTALRFALQPGSIGLAPRATWMNLGAGASRRLVVMLVAQHPVKVLERG